MIAVIYSKDNCPFCEKAKHLLASHDIEYAENKIGVDITREELLELLPNARTVPQIYLYGNYIGTYDQLVEYFENNTTGSTEGKL